MRLAVVQHVIRENDGQGRVNLEVIRAALARGWKVMLFAAELKADFSTHPNLTWVKIDYGKLPTYMLRYQVFAWRSLQAIRKHRSEFDILHANGFITWAAADVNAVHFVHRGWYRSGFYPFSPFGGVRSAYQYLYTRLNMCLERVALKRARTIIAVSKRVGDELKQAGIEGETDVIFNGASVDAFTGVARDRALFKLPEDKFLLLFVGDIRNSRKNLDTVLRAMAKLPPEIELAVGGEARGSVHPKMAQDLGIANRVHFLGHVKATAQLMASCDAFVFPSRYDPWALVIPEAMAAGLPVIASARAGASELLGNAGVVLQDPDDVDGMVQAVKTIQADPSLRAAMRTRGREAVKQNSWQAMAERYLAVYERTLQEKQRGEPLPAR